ncbi:hypothetical protein M422DRAFT_114490, partial [Sphaerobolus stellatus SS14]
FRKQYGDCYISGFVEGGDLHGIVSIKVLESSKKEQIVSQLKSVLNDSEKSEFTLSKAGSESALSSILRQTETSITVNYSGGGAVKGAEWSLESLLKAAAGFPAKVAACPKRTYAILTRYDCNIHFRAYAQKYSLILPEYTLTQRYVSDLLDMYVGWKHTLAVIQDVLLHPADYTESRNASALEIGAASLVNTRKSVVKKMMNLVVDEIDKLDKNPESLAEIESSSEIESPEAFTTRLPV